jgi:DNA-binding MarR family transcriptional regulator
VTKRVDRLIAAGLVSRERSSADGRGRVVRLTPAGLSVIDEAFTAHMANERRLLEVLSATEVRQLEKLLTTWLTRIEPPGTT